MHSIQNKQRCTTSLLLLCLTIIIQTSSLASAAFLNNPMYRISNDFKALTRKVTARHILLPPKSTDAALMLKQKIRNRIYDKSSPAFIEDAFATAAERFSLDEDTAARGGLLGNLVSMGYCRSPKLDQACFQIPIGEIAGPIESEYGCHLLLVSERTNCPKLDGKNTKIVRGEDGVSAVFTKSNAKDPTGQFMEVAIGQMAFWIVVGFLGFQFADFSVEVAGRLPDF